MITKEEFVKLIDEHVKHYNMLNKLSDITGDDNIFENNIVKYGLSLFEHTIDKHFNDDGRETIYWWLYEDNIEKKIYFNDSGKEDIVLKTSEDLWNFVKDDMNN